MSRQVTTRIVEVTPYNPDWVRLAESEIRKLRAVFGESVVRWDHIGSTAVPGLAAKPVIDLMGEAVDSNLLENYNAALQRVGYVAMGEYGIPGRRYYFRKKNNRHTHHLHIFASGDAGLERHRALRDYLRNQPQEAGEYGALKVALAHRFPTDVDGYMAGKAEFVKNLERRALEWRLRNCSR